MTARFNDWIEWNGSVAPPVDKGAVQVRWRDGEEGEDLASALDWVHRGRGGDIVAYRLLDTPKSPETPLTWQPTGSHYRDAEIQPVEFIEANKLGFLEGCIIKRAHRHGHHTGKGAEDIRKIIHEAQLLLQLRYGEAA